MLYVYVLGQDIGINDNKDLPGSIIVYLEQIYIKACWNCKIL